MAEIATVLPERPGAIAPPRAARPSPPLPELLAPAGDWECARAAVENGADAIYFGLERFNKTPKAAIGARKLIRSQSAANASGTG